MAPECQWITTIPSQKVYTGSPFWRFKDSRQDFGHEHNAICLMHHAHLRDCLCSRKVGSSTQTADTKERRKTLSTKTTSRGRRFQSMHLIRHTWVLLDHIACYSILTVYLPIMTQHATGKPIKDAPSLSCKLHKKTARTLYKWSRWCRSSPHNQAVLTAFLMFWFSWLVCRSIESLR